MRTLIKATLVIAASASLFACKPKPPANEELPVVVEEDGTSDDAQTASTERVEACNITMTTPENEEWTTYWSGAGDGASEVHSSHWSNATEKEAQAQNNQQFPLQITCSSSESPSIVLGLNAEGSTETDVPMAGGTYQIWGKEQAAQLKGGQFLASALQYAGRSFDSRSGTLTISRFDSEGVAGSFVIDGAEMNEEATPIHLEGTFDIPCRTAVLESDCATEANQ